MDPLLVQRRADHPRDLIAYQHFRAHTGVLLRVGPTQSYAARAPRHGGHLVLLGGPGRARAPAAAHPNARHTEREGKEGFTRAPYTVNLRGKDQTPAGEATEPPPSANDSRRGIL